MRDQITLTGIVLSSTPVGDYDKRIVLLTKERGKITAFARGARKPSSALLGISEPFNFGKFTVNQGYDAYYLVSGEIKEYFLDVKNDIDGICYGTYFCDILEYLCVDGVGDINILNLIYVTLKSLSKTDRSKFVIRRVFELRVLFYDGIGMETFRCVKCGKSGKENISLTAFYLAGNGLLCSSCASGTQGAIPISQTAVYTLQYIGSAPLDQLYGFKLSDEVWKEVDLVIGQYFQSHVSKNFKSLQILQSLS